jgi:hypothetical protein
MSRPVEESDDEDVIVPGTPPGTAPIIEESQGADTILPCAFRGLSSLRFVYEKGCIELVSKEIEALAEPLLEELIISVMKIAFQVVRSA